MALTTRAESRGFLSFSTALHVRSTQARINATIFGLLVCGSPVQCLHNSFRRKKAMADGGERLAPVADSWYRPC